MSICSWSYTFFYFLGISESICKAHILLVVLLKTFQVFLKFNLLSIIINFSIRGIYIPILKLVSNSWSSIQNIHNWWFWVRKKKLNLISHFQILIKFTYMQEIHLKQNISCWLTNVKVQGQSIVTILKLLLNTCYYWAILSNKKGKHSFYRNNMNVYYLEYFKSYKWRGFISRRCW